MTGGSRGIGKAIALKVARDGANVVIAAKTTEKHPKLEGTIYTAAKEGKSHLPPNRLSFYIFCPATYVDQPVEAVGGKCLPVQCDLRDEEAVKVAIDKTLQKFGNLDILVNNASAISLTGTEVRTVLQV